MLKNIANDFVASESSDLPATSIARWNANIEAIKVLKRLESDQRPATPAEQTTLSKYSGFGDSAFEQGFSRYAPRDNAWADRKEELKGLITDEEYKSIGQSRLNAFYTSPEVVKAMWRGIKDMGGDQLDNPRVLEPSAGSGRFLAYQPADMAAKSERTAVELDDLTAGITKHLYPNTEVWHTGFERAPLPDNHYDIAISNVPFGNYGVHDPEYLRSGKKFLTGSIHNYFFAKTLDKLRPGGVMAFVTTHHTMDAPAAKRVREHLAEQADLVGAVRLPESAFGDTQVVTDIIYLRKREPGEPQGDTSWVDTQQIEVAGDNGYPQTFRINNYFAEHPEMVLGEHSAEGSMYRGETYTVKRDSNDGPLQPALATATGGVADSPLSITPRRTSDTPRQQPRQQGQTEAPGVDTTGLTATQQAKAQKIREIGVSARGLLAMESSDADDERVEAARTELRQKYEDYVKANKSLNSQGNRSLVARDPDAPLVLSLEGFNRTTKNWEPAGIFSRRMVGAPASRDVASPSDAMAVSLNEKAGLDFEYMGQLLGQKPNDVQSTLSKQGLIFHNPVGNWEPANEYLTGRVRDKLKIAQQVAEQKPEYQGNVKALEDVIPEDIRAGDISTPLGAPWIPAGVVNEWVDETWRPYTSGRDHFQYAEDTGQWAYRNKIGANAALMDSEWGTKGMSADEILYKSLQGAPVSVTKPNPDGEGRVRDNESTLEAQAKAKKMQEAFSSWIWTDKDREERLERIYNDTHNSIRPRVFDGSHQTFPGMSAKWRDQMREHQSDAIFRTVHDGTVLLAHEVGFGKTAVMVASAMERKRLGLADKSVFVVPKATHKQFISQFQEVYPGAKLLAPESTDFGKEKREVFLNRIATGDWDGVILTGDQFKSIPVSPETESKWIASQVDEMRSAYADLDDGGNRESRTQKDIQKKVARLEVRLQNLRSELSEGTDKGVLYFEDLGIDQMYVDEADRYKNLPFATAMGQVKGLPNTESQRAWDMFLKVQHLQGQGERKSGSFAEDGVAFATGTPIANTIAEAWTMMRYLQLPELRRRGLHHFDPWAKTYGSIRSGMEQTPAGQYKVVQRFARFENLPELSQLWQNVADVRVASEVPEMMAARPRLMNQKGEPKPITEVAPAHAPLQEYMGELVDRVNKLGQVDPREDNMLLISSDARKAALDMRLVDPKAESNPRGKVVIAAENIAEIYRKEEADKGTQLVFLDIATPKGKKDAAGDKDSDRPDDGDEEMSGQEQGLVNDMYAVLKRNLLSEGVPEDQIAFIHDYKTPKAREDLFAKVNDGDVRVLVGSTEMMGVGVNVQERAAALHHLDAPWRPRDIEQREGRIVRQGNEVYGPVHDEETGKVVINPGRGVQIYQYVQEGSFDVFMWQAIESKGHAVKALMKRNITSRSVEDIDPLVLGAAEAKALASGNPLVIRAEELKNKVNTMRMERAGQLNQASEAASQIKRLERTTEGYREQVAENGKGCRVVGNVRRRRLCNDGRRGWLRQQG